MEAHTIKISQTGENYVKINFKNLFQAHIGRPMCVGVGRDIRSLPHYNPGLEIFVWEQVQTLQAGVIFSVMLL